MQFNVLEHNDMDYKILRNHEKNISHVIVCLK